MGVACGAENAYPSGAPDFTSGFHRGSFVSPYFRWFSCYLDFDFWLFLLF